MQSNKTFNLVILIYLKCHVMVFKKFHKNDRISFHFINNNFYISQISIKQIIIN